MLSAADVVVVLKVNLIVSGANINESDKYGTSPLYRSIDSCWEDLTEFLLDNSCDVNKGSANETCFHALVRNDRLCSISNAKRFLKAGKL